MYFNELVSTYDSQRRERNIYHDLMRDRVREILLVGSLYDSFVVESDGVLTEQIYGEYFKLNLNTIPRITCAYTEESAIELFRDGRFDLVVVMASTEFDMPLRLAVSMKSTWPDIPILLMVTDNSSLAMLDMSRPELAVFNRIFVWNGYSKLFVGMIKYIEDWRNARADTHAGPAGLAGHRAGGHHQAAANPDQFAGQSAQFPWRRRLQLNHAGQAGFHPSRSLSFAGSFLHSS